MAKLFTYTDADNSNKLGAALSKNVLSLSDITSGRSLIKLKRLDGSNNLVVTASNSAATITTRMNDKNTSDINNIVVPVIVNDTTGEVNASQSIIVNDIFRVIEYPSNASQSIIQVQNATLTQLANYRASRSVAQIVAAANA